MNQRQIPKGFDIFYTNFWSYRADVAQKPFLKNRNENDVTVSIFICNKNVVTITFLKKTSNGNDVTVSIFRDGK
jgi:hypothetical protein